MTSSIRFFLLLVLLGLNSSFFRLVAQSTDSQIDNKRIIVNLREGESKKKVTLPKGKVFWVRLKGNPTTGYLWNYTALKGSKVVISGGKYQFFHSKNNSDVVGAPGYFEFPFETVSFGKKTIHFFYGRPWEKDIPPAKSVELTVTVDGEN